AQTSRPPSSCTVLVTTVLSLTTIHESPTLKTTTANIFLTKSRHHRCTVPDRPRSSVSL
uniref:Uncharacterized protein n=1 Tax=Cucumis melo TaxID=3656 RepID=A0A9I9DYF3_CUCME